MDEFKKLQAEISTVDLSALAVAADISVRHLQRIRKGDVSSTTLRTVERIRNGLKAMKAPKRRRKSAAADVAEAA